MILSIIFLLISLILSVLFSLITYTYSIWFVVLFVCLIPFYYLIIFGIYIVFLFFATLFISKKKAIKKPSKFAYNVIKESLVQVFLVLNVQIHFIDNGLLKNNQLYLFVSNHISNYDPLVMIYALKKRRLICVTKPENYNIPIAGGLMHKAGFISINRTNAFKALESINKAAETLDKHYGDILIFPEGTRNKNKTNLPFHAGSFKICYKANVPIAICSIKNTELIKKNLPFKRTHVYFEILKVIEPEDFNNQNTVQLAEFCQKLIYNHLDEK